MAKLVYLCYRNPEDLRFTEDDLERLAQRLTPDHISASVRTVTCYQGIVFSIITPNEAIQIHEASVGLGNIEVCSVDWWKPGAPVPEGAYALFRANEEKIELVTDIVASRSIWYVHTEKLFIASTSQRAIIACLQSYEPNPKVYPWLLSSGCLGPELSWDRRICKMRGDSRVVLDRRSWELSEHTTPVTFEVELITDQEHERRLENALQTTFERLDLDWQHYVLALSGGYDSRYSMAMLRKHADLRYITWGTKTALQESNSDACIAHQLAQKYRLPHEYFCLDLSNEPIDRLFDRNLMAVEGRIDHLHAAMDGFIRYKQLHEMGTIGLIRSDVGFNEDPVTTRFDVIATNGFYILKDYSNISPVDINEMEPQELPDYLQQHHDESLVTWRDRLYHEFRIPSILAALAEGRLSYMEQVNPLLAHRIIQRVRMLPDHLRTDKVVFTRIVNHLIPDVPIASKRSTLAIPDLLAHEEVKTLFYDVLESQQVKTMLPAGILNCVLGNLTQEGWANRNLLDKKKKSILVRFLPAPFRRTLLSSVRQVKKPTLNPERLALRCFIIARMQQILADDARVLN